MTAPSTTDDAAYARRLLAIVLTCTLFAVMTSSMVNVALPTLMRDFHIGIATSVWLYTGYTLPFAVTMPLLGVLGERSGAKRVFLAGVLLFLAASILCSAAWSYPSLLAFRAIQALGAAAVVPNGMVLIAGAFPPTRRGQALGIWSAVSGVATGVGPALGGVLTQYASWHAIFWINVPFLLAAAAVGRQQIRETARHGTERPFDIVGSALMAAGLGALLVALSMGQETGWTQPAVLVLFAIAVVALPLFPLWEARTAAPLLPLQLIRTRTYGGAVSTIFLQSMVLFSLLLLIPIYLQSLRGHTPTEAGIMILPMSAATIIAAPIGGRLSDRFGPRPPTLAGLVASAIGVAALSAFSLTTGYIWLAIVLALIGAGFGLSTSPLTSTALNAAPPGQRGTASGFFSTIRFVGAVVGATALGVLLSNRTTADLAQQTAPTAGLRHALAFLQGFHDVYLVGTVIAVAAILAALTLRPAHEVGTALEPASAAVHEPT